MGDDGTSSDTIVEYSKEKKKKIDFSFYPSSHMAEILSNWPLMKAFLAGAFSGTCSTLLFQPLDLVKTRIQNPVATLGGTKHHGMVALMFHVIKKEKLQGLWRGTIPSITRCVPGMGLYFSTLSFIESKLSPDEKPSPFHAMCYGFIARTFACTTLLPVTVIKTRFESGIYGYGSVPQALMAVYRTEGCRGLFSGLVPTLVRDVPFSGLYLLFYTQTKLLVPEDWKEGRLQMPANFTCGLAAGILASVATHPADVVKTRMQLFPERYISVSSTLASIYQEDGVGGYFRGLAPRLVRRTLMTAMAWTIYEQVKLGSATRSPLTYSCSSGSEGLPAVPTAMPVAGCDVGSATRSPLTYSCSSGSEGLPAVPTAMPVAGCDVTGAIDLPWVPTYLEEKL